MTQFTAEEELSILQDFTTAALAGNDEEASRIIKQLPLAAPVAKAAKEVLGVEKLLSFGYDLSEAEAAYGKDWLAQ